MPETALTRREIVEAYYALVHPANRPAPPVLTGFIETFSQLSYGLSYQAALRIGEPQAAETAAAAASTSRAILPPEATIVPMTHQLKTGEKIAANLQRGISTAILGDPLGAGKTLTALLAYLSCCQYQPNLGLVITVPEIVMTDWKVALAQVGIPESACFSILAPGNIANLNIAQLPRVILVKQSLTLSNNNQTHQFFLEKLKRIYKLSRVHIFDEQTLPNRTIKDLFKAASENLRIILSGTIVTNAIPDIASQFEHSFQPGSSCIHDWMTKASTFFTRYFTSAFAGTSENLPGTVFCHLLNFSSLLQRSLYSRFSNALPIQLPPSRESYVVINPEAAEDVQAVGFGLRERPRMLLSQAGMSVDVDTQMNARFLESHKEEWYPRKLDLLLQSCIDTATEGRFSDKLLITASLSTTQHLVADLQKHEAIKAKFVIIPLSTKAQTRNELIADARKNGKSILFITQSANVEGFNIQKHLAHIIFFDAVRDAGDFIQACGRGVRQGNQSSEVLIEQYCTKAIAKYVKTKIATTRKAKALLEIIQADPTAAFHLLVADAMKPGTSLRTGVTLELVYTSVHRELEYCAFHLKNMLSLTDSRSVILYFLGLQNAENFIDFDPATWRAILSQSAGESFHDFRHPFLFADHLDRFAFDETSRKSLNDISEAMIAIKTHFANYLISANLEEILRSDLVALVSSLDLHLLCLQALLEKVRSMHAFDTPTLTQLLHFAYSVLGSVSPEFLATRQELINYLGARELFRDWDLNHFLNEPLLLRAYLQSQTDITKLSAHLIDLINRATVEDLVPIENLLSQLVMEAEPTSQTVVTEIGPAILDYVSKLEADGRGHHPIHLDNIYLLLGSQAKWAKILLDKAENSSGFIRADLSARIKLLIEQIPHSQQKESTALRSRFKQLSKSSGYPRTHETEEAFGETGEPNKKAARYRVPPQLANTFFSSASNSIAPAAAAAAPAWVPQPNNTSVSTSASSQTIFGLFSPTHTSAAAGAVTLISPPPPQRRRNTNSHLISAPQAVSFVLASGTVASRQPVAAAPTDDAVMSAETTEDVQGDINFAIDS